MHPRALFDLIERFRSQQRAGLFPGGQIAVRRHGRLVANEAVGFGRGVRPVDGEPLQRATLATPFPLFSAGKPLIAMAVALLEERGRLDVSAPIREVFPEFGARGKQRITTLDVLTHRGGIPMPEFIDRPEDWSDWNKVVDALCAVRPTHARGVLAYHPLEFGWVLAEVVRRVAGRPLPEFLHDEFLEPAGLGSLRFGVSPDDVLRMAQPYWLGGRRVYIGRTNMAVLFERALAIPAIYASFIPGAGLVGDAASLTAFYALLLAGTRLPDGRQLLSEQTIHRYTQRHAFGWCRSNRAPLAVGRGFLLGTRVPSIYGWWDTTSCFGHPGAFSTVAFADRRTGLAVAFVTNANRGPVDMVRRFVSLGSKARELAIAPPRLGWMRR